MPSEFALIERYFTRPTRHTALAGGDDAALIRPTPGMELVVSSDMLVSGTHFFPDTDPDALGWKTLAVNVSDLAAMGSQPRWATLSLALPAVDESWLSSFAAGFYRCADRFGVDLVGGDTTRGPLTLSVTIFGEAPLGKSLLRSGARPGDDVWISGYPGRAALGLANLQGGCVLAPADHSACLAALHHPEPRLALGLGLRDIASSAIDVSDGLLGDLGHLLDRSGLSARLRIETLPAPAPQSRIDPDRLQSACLNGGDDYELLFTAPPDRRPAILALGTALSLALTPIGKLSPEDPGTIFLDAADGRTLRAERHSYDHFA